MAQVQMTIASSGNKFSISDTNIIKVVTDTLGAMVQYINEPTGQRYQEVVTESPTDIASVSTTLIAITDANTEQTYWISISRMGTIDESGEFVSIEYDAEGAAPQQIPVTQTITELYTLIYEKQGDSVYLYDEVSATVDTITLAAAEGDLTSTFVAGTTFTVFGSSTAAMNTIWVVDSVAFSGGKTVITVTGTIPSGASESGSIWLQV